MMNVPLRLTSTMRSQSSSVWSRKIAGRVIPALLIRRPDGTVVAASRAFAFHGVAVGDRQLDRDSTVPHAPSRFRGSRNGFGVHVDDGGSVPGGDQFGDDRLADASSPAADDRDRPHVIRHGGLYSASRVVRCG